MTTHETSMDTKFLLHKLLNDIREGITTIYPEYRDPEYEESFPLFEITKLEDCEGAFTPPLPDDLHHATIELDSKRTAEMEAGPILTHELTHYLQYLRGEGGYGSTGDWKQFDPNEQEADEMEVALFWDFEPGKRWRQLQAIDTSPEADKHIAEWLRKLHEVARARRMLWERIEKELASSIECGDAQKPSSEKPGTSSRRRF